MPISRIEPISNFVFGHTLMERNQADDRHDEEDDDCDVTVNSVDNGISTLTKPGSRA
jgi:hypothetical protein